MLELALVFSALIAVWVIIRIGRQYFRPRQCVQVQNILFDMGKNQKRLPRLAASSQWESPRQ